MRRRGEDRGLAILISELNHGRGAHCANEMADEEDKRVEKAPSRSEPISDISTAGEIPAVSTQNSKGKESYHHFCGGAIGSTAAMKTT